MLTENVYFFNNFIISGCSYSSSGISSFLPISACAYFGNWLLKKSLMNPEEFLAIGYFLLYLYFTNQILILYAFVLFFVFSTEYNRFHKNTLSWNSKYPRVK